VRESHCQITRVAGDFVVEQGLLEDLHAAFPVDVEPAAGEEAHDGVSVEVVDPSLAADLAHQGVNPGEACYPVLSAVKSRFCLRSIGGVLA
jgi:hypothetical protein